MQRGFSFGKWLSTFILCFLFWLLLTMSFAPRELILGALVSGVTAGFAHLYFIHDDAFYLYNPVRLVLMGVYFLFVFLWEVIKANLSMARLVLSPRADFHPGISRIPASEQVRSLYGLAAVSNCITLTPGTITMDVAEDEQGRNYYYVHWIDVSETDRDKAGEIIKGRMERWIGRIWK